MMEIIGKMARKQQNNWDFGSVTIAFLGDSVTQGCFELYQKNDGAIETYFDQEGTYHGYVARILSRLYPSVPVNIINAGISGDNAPHGAMRLERDVIRHQPDLAVVCYGLNDVMNGREKVGDYIAGLQDIFQGLKKAGIETIFMTPNMMDTELSCHLTEALRGPAIQCREAQTDGTMDFYMEKAVKLCRKMDILVCDCYSRWKKLESGGVAVTDLLANYTNHPRRDVNWLFAVSLVETMFGM